VQMASYLGQKQVEEMVTTWMHGAAVKLMHGDNGDIYTRSEQTSAVQPSAYDGHESEWEEVTLSSDVMCKLFPRCLLK
jgi:hypothetical protein